MRFIDPLITLWHMGGGIPTHLGMALYCRAVRETIGKYTASIKED